MPSPSTTEKCVVVGFSGKTRARSAEGVARIRMDRSDQSLDPPRVGERHFVDPGEGGVAQELVAIAERALFDLGEPVHPNRAAAAQPGGDALRSQRHLREHGPRRGCTRRENLGAEEGEPQRRPDLCLVTGEVAARDEAADPLLAVRNVAGDLAAVEAVLGPVANGLERLSELWLLEDRARHRGGPGRQEDAGGLGVLGQVLALCRDRLGDVGGHGKAVTCQTHGRLHDRLPREAAGAALGEGQARDGTRDARGERACRRGGRGTGRAEEEIAPCGPGSDLPKVDGENRSLRVARDPEPSAADVSGLGPRHGQGEGHGNGGVGGVAPLAEDVDAHLRRHALLGGHGTAGPERYLGELRGRRRGRRQGEEGRSQPPFHCAILPGR